MSKLTEMLGWHLPATCPAAWRPALIRPVRPIAGAPGGPRTVGKTTSSRHLARKVVSLDVPAEAEASRFHADTAPAVIPEPVLLEEWPEVPELIGAVRRTVELDSRPGRFPPTGSARARRGADAWPGIGQITSVGTYGLTVGQRRILRLCTKCGSGSLAVRPATHAVGGSIGLMWW